MIRIKTVPLAIISIVTMLGGIVIAKSVGYYETTASKDPVKFKTGELAGLPNPADIRGSYTWVDIEKAFGVPAKESAAAFSAPGHALDPAARVSELETIYAGILPAGLEIGTGAVRLFVSLYTGLPFEAEEGSVLPEGALALLAKRPGMDTEALRKFIIPGTSEAVQAAAQPAAAPVATLAPAAAKPAQAATPPAGAALAAPVTAEAPPATTAVTGSGSGGGSGAGTTTTTSGRAVVGKTTYGDLYDWGLTEVQIESTTGFKPGPRTQSVREAAAAAGIEFSTFKTALQALVDKTAL